MSLPEGVKNEQQPRNSITHPINDVALTRTLEVHSRAGNGMSGNGSHVFVDGSKRSHDASTFSPSNPPMINIASRVETACRDDSNHGEQAS